MEQQPPGSRLAQVLDELPAGRPWGAKIAA